MIQWILSATLLMSALARAYNDPLEKLSRLTGGWRAETEFHFEPITVCAGTR